MAAQSNVNRTEQDCCIGGQTIRGFLYRPDSPGKLPLVICSHGFGATSEREAPYAQALAEHGMAAYAYDFRGGAAGSRSDGDTTDMSVMTEVADLQAVLAAAEDWDFVDASRIVLLGASQGGYVSAVTAAREAGKIAALVLLYPAFVAGDDMHKAFRSLDEVPAKVFYRNQLEVGYRYFADLWNYDPYGEIGRYTGPVLIIHGTADPVVPVSYSESARDVYEDAVLKLIPGGGHGFNPEDRGKALADIMEFLQAHSILPGSGK